MRLLKWITTLLLVHFLMLPVWAQHDEGKAQLEGLRQGELEAYRNARILLKKEDPVYGYDIFYHRIYWNIDPAVNLISGSVTTYFTVLREGLSQLVFDAGDSLDVDSVIYNGQSINYSRANLHLTIDLPGPLQEGVRDSLTVYYHGDPIVLDSRSITKITHASVPVVWTLSQPYGAKDWWPCKQSLNDKIDSVDIHVTTLDTYQVASNGLLRDTLHRNGMVTYHWKHEYPIPAYLIAIGITNYEEYLQYVPLPDGDSLLIQNYLYPETAETARDQLGYTLPVMKLFSEKFEDYPFAREKYGHAQFGFGGGMEHQTMSFMGGFHPDLIAHELAHQWFGDKVTCGSWQHIWLNEGFATYLTGLTYEFLNAPGEWDEWKSRKISDITESPGGSVFVYDTSSVERTFDGRLTYNKGAYLLHMLRWRLGDDDFFEGVQNYLADTALAYDYALTDDLIRHMEQAGGEDLGEFFQDWFYGQGFPTYKVTWSQDGTNRLTLRLEQSSSHGSVDFFEMPVPLLLTGTAGQDTLVLDHEFDGQEFTYDPGFKVNTLKADPEQWILARWNVVQETTNEFGFLVFPNPVKRELKMMFSFMCHDLESIRLFDVRGSLLHVYDVNRAVEPNEELTLQLPTGLASGEYILHVECGEELLQKKIRVQQ